MKMWQRHPLAKPSKAQERRAKERLKAKPVWLPVKQFRARIAARFRVLEPTAGHITAMIYTTNYHPIWWAVKIKAGNTDYPVGVSCYWYNRRHDILKPTGIP